MNGRKNIILAAKCAPEDGLLSVVEGAGIEAVELYLSGEMLKDVKAVVSVCLRHNLRYALHAPNDSFMPDELFTLFKAVDAQAVTMHDIFWDDEWERIAGIFKDERGRICIENTSCVHEPLRFMRRYGMGRCLDLEHLQMEVWGVYEEEFVRVMGQASHIHMTGYSAGSRDMWHSHIHHAPEHSRYMLDLLSRAGYRGMVVSESRVSLQTAAEFKALKEFFAVWRSG